jgi:lipoprotein-anchoring transpeptidase ErfK/SrfK
MKTPVLTICCAIAVAIIACVTKSNAQTTTHLISAPARGGVVIEKQFEYDQHTLADTFIYNKTTRYFQWDKIREQLHRVDSMQAGGRLHWGVLQNKSNSHGQPPLVRESHTNEYNRPADRNSVEQYQGIPLFAAVDDTVPELYGRDGSPVIIVATSPAGDRYIVEGVNVPGRWSVPMRYVRDISDTVVFNRVAVVDRTMQSIATFERAGRGHWLVRSMNPATTGAHNPPYQQPTPLGIFVVQDKVERMLYTKDGSSEIAGYAPWASRFSGGGYIHGVPLNSVGASPVEFSSTLGTIPRSHMCVRNATSHAKFVYDWAPKFNSLVVVIE